MVKGRTEWVKELVKITKAAQGVHKVEESPKTECDHDYVCAYDACHEVGLTNARRCATTTPRNDGDYCLKCELSRVGSGLGEYFRRRDEFNQLKKASIEEAKVKERPADNTECQHDYVCANRECPGTPHRGGDLPAARKCAKSSPSNFADHCLRCELSRDGDHVSNWINDNNFASLQKEARGLAVTKCEDSQHDYVCICKYPHGATPGSICKISHELDIVDRRKCTTGSKDNDACLICEHYPNGEECSDEDKDLLKRMRKWTMENCEHEWVNELSNGWVARGVIFNLEPECYACTKCLLLRNGEVLADHALREKIVAWKPKPWKSSPSDTTLKVTLSHHDPHEEPMKKINERLDYMDDKVNDNIVEIREDLVETMAAMVSIQKGLAPAVREARRTPDLSRGSTAYLRPKCRKAVTLIEQVSMEMDGVVILASKEGKTFEKKVIVPDGWLIRDGKGQNKIVPTALLSAERTHGLVRATASQLFGRAHSALGTLLVLAAGAIGWTWKGARKVVAVPVACAGGMWAWWKKPGLWSALVEKVKKARGSDLAFVAFIAALLSIVPIIVIRTSYREHLKAAYPETWIAEQEFGERLAEAEENLQAEINCRVSAVKNMDAIQADLIDARGQLATTVSVASAASIAPLTSTWFKSQEAKMVRIIAQHGSGECPDNLSYDPSYELCKRRIQHAQSALGTLRVEFVRSEGREVENDSH